MSAGGEPREGAAPAAGPANASRRRGLVRMRRLALWLLIAAAAVFVVAVVLEARAPWLGYVRAAAEGAMVGALADWFAVTALFRRPLGLPIPHTAIIPSRKDEIGEALAEFVETEFLTETIVRERLAGAEVGARLGSWLAEPANARRVAAEASDAAGGILAVLDDREVQAVLERLAIRLLEPEWAPAVGRGLDRLVAQGRHRDAVALLLERAETWLETHPEAFGAAVSSRLPAWLPLVARRFVDEAVGHEAVRLVHAMRTVPDHPAVVAIDRYLASLADELQHDPETIARAEALKASIAGSARLREVGGAAWRTLRASLSTALADPESALRRGAVRSVADLGRRLAERGRLTGRVDDWVADAAAYLVRHHRHDLAGIIRDTVAAWDARETSEKLELYVGRDLQFIRINGTVVGALAGLSIFTIAGAFLPVLG